jgi:hypothetical protein
MFSTCGYQEGFEVQWVDLKWNKCINDWNKKWNMLELDY